MDAKYPSLLQIVMLALKTTGNESHIAKLRPLLNHPDPSVSWLAKDTLDSLETLSKKARTRLNKADILAEFPPIMEQ